MKMPKSVIVTAVLGVVCALVYAVLGAYAGSIPPEVVYPQGGLSDSIFVLQNMNYEAVAGLSETVRLGETSLIADAAPGSSATVGGSTVRTNNGFYFLYSATNEGRGTEEIIRASLTGVISPSADPSATSVTLLDSSEGNLHGSRASYGLYEIAASDGKKAWACVYRLRVDEETFGDVGGEAVLGCASFDYSTQGLANLQAFASAMVGTVRIEERKE